MCLCFFQIDFKWWLNDGWASTLAPQLLNASFKPNKMFLESKNSSDTVFNQKIENEADFRENLPNSLNGYRENPRECSWSRYLRSTKWVGIRINRSHQHARNVSRFLKAVKVIRKIYGPKDLLTKNILFLRQSLNTIYTHDP